MNSNGQGGIEDLHCHAIAADDYDINETHALLVIGTLLKDR